MGCRAIPRLALGGREILTGEVRQIQDYKREEGMNSLRAAFGVVDDGKKTDSLAGNEMEEREGLIEGQDSMKQRGDNDHEISLEVKSDGASQQKVEDL